jgi:hypothetical protein
VRWLRVLLLLACGGWLLLRGLRVRGPWQAEPAPGWLQLCALALGGWAVLDAVHVVRSLPRLAELASAGPRGKALLAMSLATPVFAAACGVALGLARTRGRALALVTGAGTLVAAIYWGLVEAGLVAVVDG